MSVSDAGKQIVRTRANFACEYCGVTEVNCGGELTIDHFRPKSQNGTDDIENLVYCCVRCNLYKSDFWDVSNNKSLWNPRLDDDEDHFWETEDGRLLALTEKGSLTVKILKLNRLQLIQYRQNRAAQTEERRLYKESELTVETIYQLTAEQKELIEQQKIIIEQQQKLLKLFLKSL